jgi:hypothetical protein
MIISVVLSLLLLAGYRYYLFKEYEYINEVFNTGDDPELESLKFDKIIICKNYLSSDEVCSKDDLVRVVRSEKKINEFIQYAINTEYVKDDFLNWGDIFPYYSVYMIKDSKIYATMHLSKRQCYIEYGKHSYSYYRENKNGFAKILKVLL